MPKWNVLVAQDNTTYGHVIVEADTEEAAEEHAEKLLDAEDPSIEWDTNIGNTTLRVCKTFTDEVVDG